MVAESYLLPAKFVQALLIKKYDNDTMFLFTYYAKLMKFSDIHVLLQYLNIAVEKFVNSLWQPSCIPKIFEEHLIN